MKSKNVGCAPWFDLLPHSTSRALHESSIIQVKPPCVVGIFAGRFSLFSGNVQSEMPHYYAQPDQMAAQIF